VVSIARRSRTIRPIWLAPSVTGGLIDDGGQVTENDKDRREHLFAERVHQQDLENPGYKSTWASLSALLISHGGSAVVPPLHPNPLADVIRERGDLFVPTQLLSVVGGQSDCHSNVVALWRSGAAVAVGTGFALSQDGLWREHSWAWNASGALIETTVPRTAYFGVRMTNEPAQLFAQWIDPIETGANER
jgi:hypothetical protein